MHTLDKSPTTKFPYVKNTILISSHESSDTIFRIVMIIPQPSAYFHKIERHTSHISDLPYSVFSAAIKLQVSR